MWFVPSLFVAGSVAAAIGLEALDRHLSGSASGERLLLAFSGGPEAARAVLETIAGSILTLTGLVFSITMLVLQLTSTQYSPRALRTFMVDQTSKIAMGTFLGTFSFALVGLRAVRSGAEGSDAFVPGMLISGAFVLTLASLYMFLVYINHIAQRIQASSIISSVAHESAEVLERLYPDGLDDSPVELPEPLPFTDISAVLKAPRGDVIVSIDEQSLVHLGKQTGVRFRVVRHVGEFIAKGTPLVEVSGKTPGDPEQVFRHVHLGHQRTMEQDLGYGLRQLVDIALRALSPSVNDPTTASQALDRLHDLLCRLGNRQFPRPTVEDDEGETRLVLTVPDWEHYVRLALGEIVHYGSDHPRIQDRLDEMYEDFVRHLPHDRTEAVRRVLAESGWVPRAAYTEAIALKS